jgi:hypothetical protein
MRFLHLKSPSLTVCLFFGGGALRIKSSKAKGKRAVFETRDLLLDNAPHLEASDIVKPIGSRSGADLVLSQRAKEVYPFSIEVKNQEKINIWESIAQSERHGAKEGLTPLLVFKRNRSELYVTLKLEDLLRLLQREPAISPFSEQADILSV